MGVRGKSMYPEVRQTFSNRAPVGRSLEPALLWVPLPVFAMEALGDGEVQRAFLEQKHRDQGCLFRVEFSSVDDGCDPFDPSQVGSRRAAAGHLYFELLQDGAPHQALERLCEPAVEREFGIDDQQTPSSPSLQSRKRTICQTRLLRLGHATARNSGRYVSPV